MTDMTAGHPVTMLLGLLGLLGLLELAESDVVLHAHEVLRRVAARDAGLIARAMQHARLRLRLAGLLRHDDGWSVLNPLVAYGLRGSVERLTAPGLATVEASDAY
jgi:hypothetical protein